jgi:argininosuccinate lyase
MLIENLGLDKGGVIHTGRSRNDINATIFMLQTRKLFQHVYQLLWKLRQTILTQAERYRDIAMPIYSQFQAALPATYSFYLLAISEGLGRDQEAFKQLYSQLAKSPLGACAGSGTSFPICQETTAALLGFSHVSNNALDAVASRDLALRLLSTLSILGTTLSRIAQDYQLWTTQEFSFFHLPDELVGSSSMMPQKKNPFLLEKIKARAVSPIGVLVSSMAAMQKTLYCNSVEVGTDALNDFSKAFTSIADSTILLELIVAKAEPIQKNLQRSNDNGITMAVCVSEILVNHGLSFREAHHKVGQTITDALANQENPIDAIYRLLPDVAQANQLWSETFSYGGGCHRHSIQKQLDKAKEQLQIDGVWMQEILAFWQKSTILRDQAIQQCISKYSETA